MKRRVLVMTVVVLISTSAFAYTFKGRVIDAETKEPIEGAVVVAQYHKNVFYIFDSDSFIFDVREALTDGKGEFHIPPKINLIQPLR
jgi:hypothetical protein